MSDQPTLAVLILAGSPAMRAGLRALLAGAPGIEVVGEASLAAIEASTPAVDVLVIDPGSSGEDWLETVGAAFPGVPAVLLESPEPALPPRTSAAAARAFLLREASAAELAAAVRAVAEGLLVVHPALVASVLAAPSPRSLPGQSPERLSERELEVLRLMAVGLPNKAIALHLGISDHTVKFHVSAILGKLGATSRTEAVTMAVRRGLIPL